MREEQRRRKKISRRRCAATIAAVLLVAGGLYAVSSRIEADGQRQERGVAQSEIGQRKQVTYEGKTYAERVGMTKLLLMGVDKQGEAARNDARQGGQADFLLLVLLDHQNHQIRTLQLDRDTMTAVEVLGVLGNPVGTREMQICLSHGYGMTEEASCENTLNAVENLLEGADIEYYVAMNLDAIGILNDALGGVTVTLEDDFTAIDPTMRQGETLTLTAEQAETFVRGRMSVGDGTNNARMARQRTYMDAAAQQLKEKLSEKANFLDELFKRLGDNVTMNIKQGRLLNEVNRSYKYTQMPVETLAGSYTMGADGFVEFHPAEDAAIQWVLQALYEPVEE